MRTHLVRGRAAAGPDPLSDGGIAQILPPKMAVGHAVVLLLFATIGPVLSKNVQVINFLSVFFFLFLNLKKIAISLS